MRFQFDLWLFALSLRQSFNGVAVFYYHITKVLIFNWLCILFCSEKESNQPRSEIGNGNTEKHKYIVNGQEAEEQLTREKMKHDHKERIQVHKKKILPLHKPQHPGRHKKHHKHSSYENSSNEPDHE